MEVDQDPNSCNIKQDNSPTGGGPAILNVSNKEEPIVNRTEGRDNVADDDYLDSFPPGYRFCPLDEELVLYYLQKKVMGLPLPQNRITEVNLYSYNPERLAELYKQYGEKEWYFFTPREKKYRNGLRPNRTAGDGYWKATGADREIKFNDSVVGYRKALVFYQGKPPKGDKTSWIMHEYRVHDPPSPKRDKGYNDMRLDDVVLCRIYKKADNKSVRTESKTEDASTSVPLIQNEDTNKLLALDEMDCSMIGNFTNQTLPEESLNICQQIYNESFPSPVFSSKYMYDTFGGEDLWNVVENFVDYPSPLQICVEPLPLGNLELSPNASKPESQESRNEELKEEDQSTKGYKRNFYEFKKE